MAPGVATAIKPKANIQRRPPPSQRAPGLGTTPKAGRTRFRPSTPARERTPAGAASPGPRQLPCPGNCGKPDVYISDAGHPVCRTCGATEESQTLVSETQFAEVGGQIRAQGVTIGAGESHRNAGAFQATGHVGSESQPTRTQASNNAKATIQRLCTQLSLKGGEDEQAMRLFGLAYAKGFVRGRSLDDVALICLYIVVRQATEQVQSVLRPKHALMLIDFAERGDIDVFALGKIYVDLAKELFFEYGEKGYGWQPIIVNGKPLPRFTAPGPEVFVPRFVDELEFPDNAARRKIMNDAYKIIASMKRDWITRGRRPAGICGAAVILAARMNNYRRTVREVVLVAKVTEITLNKRLEEFSSTPLSKSSISEFRSTALPNIDFEDQQEEEDLIKIKKRQVEEGLYQELPDACNPPVMNPKPKKRRRGEGDTAAEIEGDNSDGAEPSADSQSQDEALSDNDIGEPPAKQARIDAEGFAIPSQPASSNAPKPDGTIKKAKGRPKGAKNWRAPPTSAREKAIEQEIQDDIDENMPEMEETAARIIRESEPPEDHHEEQRDERPGEPQKEPRESQSSDSAASTKVNPMLAGNLGNVSMSPTLRANEFEDDLDVSTCVLNEEERLLKETLWVNENADWLRQDHAKRIRRQLKEDELREKGIDPAQFERNKKAQGRRRKDGSKIPGRPGDISYLTDTEYDRRASSQRSTPGGTPGERAQSEASTRLGSASPSPTSQPRGRIDAASAVQRMLHHRATFTTRLNYAAISSIYAAPSSSDGTSRASSILSDAAPSDRSRSRSMSTTAAAGNKKPEQIARTAAQKRSRIKAGLPEDTDRSDIIFGGIGGKNTGLQRSKGSLSAEKRQLLVRKGGSGSPSVEPSGGAAGVGQQQQSQGRGQEATPEYEASLRSISGSPTPGPSAPPSVSRTAQTAKNVSFAKSPPTNQRIPSETGSGSNTPRSAPPPTFQELAGTEEVVEGERSGLADAEGEEGRSLIREVVRPGAFIGDEDDEDEEDDDEDEDEEDEDEDDEGGEGVDDDPEDAFAGRLRGRY